jgi:hypothetical protein
MPDLTKEQRAELRKLAEAATPGPWQAEQTDDGHEIVMGEAIETPWRYPSHHKIEYNHGVLAETFEDDEEEISETQRRQVEEAAANANLIAAANPQALLSLLDTLDRLEADAVAWEAEVGRLKSPLADEPIDGAPRFAIKHLLGALERWRERETDPLQKAFREGQIAVVRLIMNPQTEWERVEAEAARAASSQNIQPAQEGGK